MTPHPTLRFLAAAAASAIVCSAHAETLAVKSAVTSATVYLDRAVVTRTGEVKLPAGEHDLLFDALPLSLRAESLQVGGLGAGVTILEVRHKRAALAAPSHPRAAELQKEIDALIDRDRALQSRAAANDRSLELLREIEATWVTAPRARNAAPDTAGKAPALPSLEEYSKLVTFGEEARLKSLATRADIEKQRADIGRTLAEKAVELKTLGVNNPHERTVEQVTVRVTAKAPVSARVMLTYGVTGATWSPSYDARLAYADSALKLNYYGVVQNGTGEDWTDIRMKLSTARPNLSASVPTPQGKPLSERGPVYADSSYSSGSLSKSSVTSSRFKADAPAEALRMTAGSPADEAAPPMFVAPHAALAEAGTSATFEIPATATLPNDNTPHRVTIGESSLRTELRHELVPSLAEFAYLTGKTKNNTGLPFLRGPVNVFIDDSFVSASQIPATSPNDEFTLSFGVDEAVVVKRKPLVKFTEDSGITSQNTRTTYTYVTEVTNNRRERGVFVVKEVLPVSRHEDIEVSPLVPKDDAIDRKKKTAPHHLDEQGILTSTYNLDPGKKAELTFSYSVRHPKKLSVTPAE